MRTFITTAALALVAISATLVQAGGHGHHGHMGILYGRLYPGLDRHFNCGCQGSYKYPVPPLYTYHWPGLYSHQLMTEYHSPWRFPPIKRYSDERMEVQPDDSGVPGDREPLPPAAAVNGSVKNVLPVDFAAPGLRPGQAESISVKLQRASQGN